MVLLKLRKRSLTYLFLLRAFGYSDSRKLVIKINILKSESVFSIGICLILATRHPYFLYGPAYARLNEASFIFESVFFDLPRVISGSFTLNN